MVSEYWPTYVLLAIYIVAMTVVTIIANIQNRRSHIAHDSNSPSISHISTHFLAAKNFGFVILLLTTFASVHSGYTIVGVPNEAGANGFTAMRWVGGIIFVALSMLIIFPRLRRLSVHRNYESPGDFINDRFQSKALCILITLCLCVPQLMYLAVQIHSLGATLSNLTNGELSFYAVIVVASLLILVFEALGGMRSVAYTDAVQATVMIVVFITIPIIIGVEYGGFVGQVVNSEHVPCQNSNEQQTSGCLNYATGGIADEYYLRSPSQLTIVNYVLFLVSLLSFALNPHMLQRAFTSRHDTEIKFVTAAMFVAGFLAQIPGVTTGIAYISNLPSFDAEYQSAAFQPFSAMLAVFKDQGGFVGFISYIALLAAIAGIMSTADSSLIGVSNTMSCDVFKNWLTPNISGVQTVLIGKAISICSISIAIGLAVYIKEAAVPYGVLLTLQQGILWQAFPAYALGLYTNIGTKSILLGVVVGILCDIVFVTLVFSGNDPLANIHASYAAVDKSWSSLLGVLLNVICIALGHFALKWRDDHDDEEAKAVETTALSVTQLQHGRLSIAEIGNIMQGMSEPMTKCYGLPIWLTLSLVLISAFHWIGETDAALLELYGEDKVKSFVYNGYVANVIAGLPSWTFATLIWYVLAALSGIAATAMWSTGHRYEGKQVVADKSNMSMVDMPHIDAMHVVPEDDRDDHGDADDTTSNNAALDLHEEAAAEN